MRPYPVQMDPLPCKTGPTQLFNTKWTEPYYTKAV